MVYFLRQKIEQVFTWSAKFSWGGFLIFPGGEILKSTQKAPESRGSGNDFGRFSVSFFEGRISYIRAACNYPIRNANFKSWISDIQLLSKIVEYLPENIRQRRYEKNIYKNNTNTMQCRENESRFHYLCFPVL